MGRDRAFWWVQPRFAAFTLIEVLTVVAIMALLIALLLPSLLNSREQARATMCLSHLKQVGTGLSSYSINNKAVLPWAGSFRFSLMEGKYYLGYSGKTSADWAVVNLGLLYPKHTGNSLDLFYCPNNKAVDADNEVNGKPSFLTHLQHPITGQPGYTNSHDFRISPFTSYAYALPVASARSPRDAGRDVYPEESVQDGDYHIYLNESHEQTFLGPTPTALRGKHTLHALVSDGYFSSTYETVHGSQYSANRRVFEGYHLRGYNVLYSDYHAKKVSDPGGKIHAAKLNPRDTSADLSDNERDVYAAWDYFSRNP